MRAAPTTAAATSGALLRVNTGIERVPLLRSRRRPRCVLALSSWIDELATAHKPPSPGPHGRAETIALIKLRIDQAEVVVSRPVRRKVSAGSGLGAYTLVLAVDAAVSITRLDRDVALATIKTEGLDADVLVRVRREAQAMGRLGDHPHIVTVYDIGDEDGQPFIVSEYAAGGSVEDLLGRADLHRLAVTEGIEERPASAVEVRRRLSEIAAATPLPATPAPSASASDASARLHRSRFIGRTKELAVLKGAVEAREQAPRLQVQLEETFHSDSLAGERSPNPA
jgi:serine/threonine protein kinase